MAAPTPKIAPAVSRPSPVSARRTGVPAWSDAPDVLRWMRSVGWLAGSDFACREATGGRKAAGDGDDSSCGAAVGAGPVVPGVVVAGGHCRRWILLARAA